MNIGENIRYLREKNNLTQREFCKLIGVTQSMVAQIERGTKVPSMPLGKTIADTLNCDISVLYSESLTDAVISV